MSKRGLDRARALAKTASADYAKHREAAEASVVRWVWATAPSTHPQPAYFELTQLSPGKMLMRMPGKWKLGQAQEGFDEEGRIVAVRERAAKRGDYYETFFRYERGGIAQLQYTPDGSWISAAWHTIVDGRVVATDSLSHMGGSSREYEYDDAGNVTRCVAQGVHADQPWEKTFELARC